MRCVSLVIADRHPVVLQGLAQMLGARPDFKIVASCGDGRNCIEALRKLVPDVALVDVSMPGLTGPQILAFAHSENLSTRLVLFADEEHELAMAAAAGAHGVILKNVAPELLVQSLRQVAEGQRLPPVSSNQGPPREQRNVAVREGVLAVLTGRERQIVRLVSLGLSNKAIGRQLNVTEGTIKLHLNHIYRKLEIHNRTVLAAFAMFWAAEPISPYRIVGRLADPPKAKQKPQGGSEIFLKPKHRKKSNQNGEKRRR
jgi:two-component system, NarL family, nitrate/nitrite response regulator NarL